MVHFREGPGSPGETALISLDYSIIPAIFIFLTLIVALNYLLLRPLDRIRAERESRTTGLINKTKQDLDHHMQLFHGYQARIKEARIEGYRHQEQMRSREREKRTIALRQARTTAEQLVKESRDSIRTQVKAAKVKLGEEAQEIARGIATTILQRSV